MNASSGLCPWTDRLDPRPASLAAREPFAQSVNIPYDELPSRVHELPPKGSQLVLPDIGEIATQTQGWLKSRDIQAQVIPFQQGQDNQRFRLWKPNEFLENLIDTIHPGRAVDLGCGCGREVALLAANGWQVTARDHLPDALDLARSLVERYVPHQQANVTYRCQDALNLLDQEGSYDLIYSLYFYDEAIWPLALTALKPGGLLLIESFSIQHRILFRKPDLKRTIDIDKLSALSEGFDLPLVCTMILNNRHIARILAQKI